MALSLVPAAAHAEDPPVTKATIAVADPAANINGNPPANAVPQTAGAITASSGDQRRAAQAAAAPGEEIVVTGVRPSLRSAQAIKRNSDQIVAEDIGKRPDGNIAETLQRISGIQIQIQHSFGAGSSLAIRGLTQVRTEINGGDTFAASGNSGLAPGMYRQNC